MMVNCTKDLKPQIIRLNLVEKSEVFQKIVQIMMDYLIKYILLHRVINIKSLFVIIYIK
jgi:hypothetical protein